LDSGLGWWIHLGSSAFHYLFFAGENRTGDYWDSLDWCLGAYHLFLLSMAFSVNAFLEANARSIHHLFSVYRLGCMVIRWCQRHRTKLVESDVPLADADAIWSFEQKKVVRFR